MYLALALLMLGPSQLSYRGNTKKSLTSSFINCLPHIEHNLLTLFNICTKRSSSADIAEGSAAERRVVAICSGSCGLICVRSCVYGRGVRAIIGPEPGLRDNEESGQRESAALYDGRLSPIITEYLGRTITPARRAITLSDRLPPLFAIYLTRLSPTAFLLPERNVLPRIDSILRF